MSDTPTPPAAPEQSSLHTSLLKSLHLTINPADPNPINPPVNAAPTPDTGVEVPSTIYDFSEGSGSLADKIHKMTKDGINVEPPATPAAVPPVTPPVAVAPVTPPAAVTPPLEPTPTPAPVVAEPARVKVPEFPKPISDGTILPPPPHGLDLNGLDEDEVEEVKTALFAERQYPEKYNGYGKRVLEFIQKHKQFVKQQETENPDVSFDNSNAAYQKFLQGNRPAATNSERKRLERERLLDEAASMAEKRLASKTKRLEDEVTQLKATPIVEKTLNDYRSMLKDLMPKDEDPLVVEAVTTMSGKAVEAGKEFLLLSSSLKPYDSSNETHKWLANFIQEQGELYQKSGHASLKRGTRSFVPRAKFNSLPADERAKHFTFTDEDVLQIIAVNAKAAAEYHATNEKERLNKAGYTRVAPVPAAVAPVTPAVPDVSVRASASVAPGGPLETAPSGDPFQRFMRK